ncbi:unnamed protein product [Protopolystoma xenopodis]|uniref:Uncharacterized protein n=1 Tax=Protopolystoma xenopodis TaxID=117903 RepID=A0A448X7W5_9PLAT|nr:unnamed protein product [Protopolystoma xenopodis]
MCACLGGLPRQQPLHRTLPALRQVGKLHLPVVPSRLKCSSVYSKLCALKALGSERPSSSKLVDAESLVDRLACLSLSCSCWSLWDHTFFPPRILLKAYNARLTVICFPCFRR